MSKQESEQLVLEVGKTYVFKDEDCKDRYLRYHASNKKVYNKYYKGGFYVRLFTR